MAVLLDHAETTLHAVEAMVVQVQALVSAGALEEGIERALDALALLGRDLPRHPVPQQIEEGLGGLLAKLGGRTPDQIAALPRTEAAEVHFRVELCSLISTACFVARPELMPMLAFEMVEQTLDHGVTPGSPYGFGLFALVLCAVGLYDVGQVQAATVLALLDVVPDNARRHARSLHLAAGFAKVWAEPLASLLERQQRVFYLGVESGDLEFACWGAHMSSVNSLWAGLPLDEVATRLSQAVKACKVYGQDPAFHSTYQYEIAVAVIRGQTDDPSQLATEGFEAEAAVGQYKAAGYRGPVAVTRAAECLVKYLARDLEGVLRAAADGLAHRDGVQATYMPVNLQFYEAMAAAELAKPRRGRRTRRPARAPRCRACGLRGLGCSLS